MTSMMRKFMRGAKFAALIARRSSLAACANKPSRAAIAGLGRRRARPAASRTSSSMSATACSSRPTQTDLTPQARATLDKQAQWLQQYSSYTFTIEGHADERGTREYNIALGARRAQTVRDYLTSRGIDAEPHAHRSPTARSARSRSATTSRAGRRTAAR